MKKLLISFLVVCLVSPLFSQSMPPTINNRAKLATWVKSGTFTFTNKTLTSPTITDPSISGTTAFTGLVTVTTTSALTTGTVRSVNISQTHTGDGAAILEALRVNISSAVQTGMWANAIVGRIAYSGATGDAGGGMAAAICAEVVLPAFTGPAGQYFAADLEMNAPASYVANAETQYPTAYIRYGLFGDGTAIASFEDDAYFMHISSEFTSGTGNMLYNNTMRIQVSATDWFIPLSTAEGSYTSTAPISGSVITAQTSFDPDASDGATIGTAALQFSDLFLADGAIINLGDDQDVTLTHVADTGILLNGAMYLQFRDATESIQSSTDGELNIIATTLVEVTAATFDVVGALTASSVASDGAVSGTTGTFTDEVDITKATAGMALDVNYTATSITTLVGAVDIRRTGALTGVNTESILDLNVLPALTLTEPGAGTFNYYGANIDLTSVAVTAGAGTSVLAALNLVAGTDGDAGANWALLATGSVDVDGAFTASSVASDGAVSGTTGTFTDEVDITKATAGMALDVNYTAITYTTLLGAADVRRTGNLTGVATESVIDLNVLPALTFTEPGASTVNYFGANIDLTSVAVTAGAGTSVLSALNLVAGTDADAGANWALTATGDIYLVGELDIGVTGSHLSLAATTDQAIEVYTTSPVTTGNHFANRFIHTNTQASTGGQFVMYVENTVGAAMVGAGCMYVKLDMASYQAPTGGASALNVEMVMPTGMQNGGQFNAFVIDMDCPATTDLVYNAALPIGFMKLEVYGSTASEWNDCANLFNLSGITDTADGLFDLEDIDAPKFNAALRVNIGGVEYFIGLGTDKGFAD